MTLFAMAIVHPADSPSFSSEKPFILERRQPASSMTYWVEGRDGVIDNEQYQMFDCIFEEHARKWDSIADGATAELIQLSNLPEDALART